MSESDKIKENVPMLRHDSNYNHDYQLIKAGKNVLNLPKHQVYNTLHRRVENYFINCKNNYSTNPFNTVSSFFLDFDIPKGIHSSAYQFILRYSIQNVGTTDVLVLPSPLQIEKVSLLKNSNSLGLDITDWEIYMYNLNKYYSNKNKEDILPNLNLIENGVGNMIESILFSSTLTSTDNIHYNNIHLPINLNNSDFPLFLMKDNLTIRIYFKGNILYKGVSNSNVKLSNVGLVMRCHELNKSQLNQIVKQPRFDYMFNKKVHLKFNITKLDIGIEQSIPLSGFRNVCGGMLVFITSPETYVASTDPDAIKWHLISDKMDQLYILNPTGQNIMNNTKQDWKWNQYLMSNHFGKANDFLNCMCYNPLVVANYPKNEGHIQYLGFCQDMSDSFDGVYSGGYNFGGGTTGDHVLRFTPKNSNIYNVNLHIIAFVPAIVSLVDGELQEVLL
jgi:hypothetical protein